MAAPINPTTLNASSEFVESAGTILIDLSTRQIHLIYDASRDA
jgi:hypothetical protein